MKTQACHISQSGHYPWFASLGARPALCFVLQPDVEPVLENMSLQGTLRLSKTEMVPLFGTPHANDTTPATLYWTLSFLDREKGVPVAIMLSGCTNADTGAQSWTIHGHDERAAKAVNDYVRYHLGSHALV